MPHFLRIHKYLILLFCLVISEVTGQENIPLWKTSNLSEAVLKKQIDYTTLPNSFQVYEMDDAAFQLKTENKSPLNAKNPASYFLMTFPNETGEMESFRVVKRSIFAPELQAKFPNINSYVGLSVENSNREVRFSASKYGVNAVIFDKHHGSFYIDKINNSKAYVAYQRKNGISHKMECLVEDQVGVAMKSEVQARNSNANDGILRTFRLAIATTGEYSEFHLNDRGINSNATDQVKIEAVLDAINVAMTRVNGIFERDVALTMELVANNDLLISLEPGDPDFENNNTEELIRQSQTRIDELIGFSNYDIGHTFSTGAGGLAQLNSPCDDDSKAKGVTGISTPKGDAFYVDFVAHEMGHQFGANHTFNGTAGNCQGNDNASSAVEPGSGTTIMGYAGICAPQNVQEGGDDYFHLVSIREMWLNISAGFSTCAEQTVTGNTAPVIEPLEDYTIPISTPFALGAQVTDAENDILTYTWEQLDNEAAEIPLVSSSTGGPAFRSLEPTESNIRYFPNLQTTLDGNTKNEWEVLPSVERTMNFGVNVRDNNSEVGQTASDETFLTVSAEAGPFVVTSQSSNVTWDAGTTQSITWDVANTNAAPVNCEFVNILLSHDGGTTFSEVLATNVENDGSHNIVAPNVTTSEARIMVQSVGNVFFAVNSEEFSIQDSEFIMEFAETHKEFCTPGAVSYNFTFQTFLDFNENTTFSAVGTPSGTTVTFDPTSASANDTAVEMIINGITDAHVGAFEITVNGTSNSVVKSTVISLENFSSTISAPVLAAPANGSGAIKKPYKLTWKSTENVQNNVIQVATDQSFNDIIDNAVLEGTSYLPQNLISNTTYYWRVKGQNICGESDYSEVFSFTTENEICNQYVSSSTKLQIPDDNVDGVDATIEISENILISDINVGVTVSHPYVGDLKLVLSHSKGNSVLLVSNSDRSGAAYTNTIFDAEANIPISSGSSPYTGTFIPEGDLSIFNGLNSAGTWTLNVSDNEPQDLGELVSFELFLCGVPNNFNDFRIATTSETCPDSNNGQIEIIAPTIKNYSAELNGNPYNFTSDLLIENLSPGNYDLCISDGEDFEQCYNLTIEEGVIISAKSEISKKNILIEIEEGTAPFKVYKNDAFLFETSNNQIEIEVEHGDLVAVASKNSCEGVFSKEINLLDYVSLYPNPSSSYFNISIPSDQSQVQIEMYSSAGQLIRSTVLPVKQHKIVVDSYSLPQGLYFIKVGLQEPVVLKMVKQ